MTFERTDLMATQPVTEAQVLDALREITDPDLNRDIVSLGFVKNLAVNDGRVAFTLELTTPACPVKERFQAESRRLVSAIPGVTDVRVTMTSNVRASLRTGSAVLPGVKNTVAVASGKGGVGKSTVASNLACALGAEGSRVGLLDADIYGPSAPIMFGVREQPKVQGEKLLPIERYGIRIMSLGFLADERSPVIWRGPLVARMVQQFLSDVEWGELDYLVIDLPPGTGDAQLTLAQSCPLSGAVIVTTPQEVALEDVYRAIRMFGEVKVPILGIVENMSYFVAPDTGTRYAIFGSGGGRRSATDFDVPLLAEIPIRPDVCDGGDRGVPVVVGAPGEPSAAAFFDLARAVAARLSTLAAAGRGEPVRIKFSRKD
jgi:ATP-binding protein involved in chromosome partitioning